MALPLEKLEKILREGDVGATVKFFEHATEADRRTGAPVVKEWCERLNLNWRAQFNQKEASEVAKSGVIPNWYELMPAANTAALACASLSEIKAIGGYGRIPEETNVAVLTDRHPPWIAEYAELLCDGELRTFGGNWKQVRALVLAGLCRPPKHENYVLQALNCIFPRCDRTKSPPMLVDLLLDERDWLESDFWRLFELDGNGEVSLANCEKYGKSQQGWSEALIELSRRGILSRDRLLDESLAALSRDFIQFRAGWFSRFHVAMEPSAAERAARLDVYLRLLASSIPPTVAFAVDAVAIVDKTQPLPASRLIDALHPALNARGKAVVKTGLRLLEAAAKREPESRKMICLAAVPALLNETPDVQKSVFGLLDRYGDKQDTVLRSKVAELTAAVAASLKPRLAPWLGETATRVTQPAPSPEASLSRKVVNRTDRTRAIQPLTNLDDLIHAAGAVLEEPGDPTDIERVLDGISRLCSQRPEDFETRTGPLRKRALKKRDDRRGNWPLRPCLERGLAMLLLTWIEGKDSFTEKPEELAHGQNQFAFLFRRLIALGRQVQEQRALPLLSAPTHLGGWIKPQLLVERALAWQGAGLTADIHEQVLALLRLAPEGRAQALAGAGEVTGETGQGLRFALGEECKSGPNAALWLAAWRSRQPFGDLPAFEKLHPRLGPDAGEAARYSWQAHAKHTKYAQTAWTSLEFELKIDPPLPRHVADALLPVLFHGTWQTSEESEMALIRWGMLLWPANREASFARGARRLGTSVNYADANDRDFYPYLEPLADPHAELRPMACLALTLGLAAEDPALRGHAQDGLIAAIAEGRVNVDEIGATMARLLDTGFNKLARWAKALREVARVSAGHASTAAQLIEQSLHGNPANAPRDISTFLEALLELLSETGRKLGDPSARSYLAGLTTGGKTAKLVKQLLTA